MILYRITWMISFCHELLNHYLIVVNVTFVHTRKNLGPYSTTYPSLKTLYFSRLLDSCTLQLRIVQYCKPLVLFNIGIHTSCLVAHQTHSPEYVYILCCNYIKRLLFSLSWLVCCFLCVPMFCRNLHISWK